MTRSQANLPGGIVARARGGRVLVVDDNDDHRVTVADILALEGYEVDAAASAPETLARLEAGPLPDVLVLDLLLPGGDGATLSRDVRERYGARAPRVVVVTGIASREVRRLLDVDAVLFKPVDPRELLAAVGEAAARAAEPPPSRRVAGSGSGDEGS